MTPQLPAASPDPPAETPGDWNHWHRLGRRWLWTNRRRLFDGVVSALLLFVVSLRLAGLSGGVLWVPSELRDITQLAFVAFGVGLYRKFRQRLDPNWPSGGSRVRPKGQVSLSSAEPDSAARSRRHLRGTMTWSLVGLAGVACILALGNDRLRSWNTDGRSVLYALEFSEREFLEVKEVDVLEDGELVRRAVERAKPSAVEAMVRSQRAPVHMTFDGENLYGTILIPFRFPSSPAAREFLDGIAHFEGEGADLVEKAMTRDVGELIKVIRYDETGWMHATMALFVVLHFLVVCTTAIVLAHTLTWRSLVSGVWAAGDAAPGPDVGPEAAPHA